jgi:hypothetical protein
MDDAKPTHAPEPAVVVPDHLVPAIAEWMEEAIRQAGEGTSEDERPDAVITAVHHWDCLMAGTLAPKDLVVVAELAADWQEARWPITVEQADQVARQLAVARELLELRDRARVVVREQADRALADWHNNTGHEDAADSEEDPV